MSNEDTQILWLLCAIRPPHRGQQSMMSDDLSRVSGEVHQKVELLRRQMYLLLFNLNLARWNVDTKISDVDHRCLWLERDRHPPERSSDPSQQFVHVERLCYVIVGHGIE